MSSPQTKESAQNTLERMSPNDVMGNTNDAAKRRHGIGSKLGLRQKAKQQNRVSFKNASEFKPVGEDDPKKEFESQLERSSKAKDMHPRGLRKQLREAETIEEAIAALLAASNEERQIRTKIRSASTVEEALGAMMPEES